MAEIPELDDALEKAFANIPSDKVSITLKLICKELLYKGYELGKWQERMRIIKLIGE